ncbi:hypothetical protein ABC195_03585 [Microbacterium sp. 2P01SA-2]|uniref:hypothetical protein n=1 Tax=unclassified Microbacterium TaxID=2609290 RepID=UPI00399FC78D
MDLLRRERPRATRRAFAAIVASVSLALVMAGCSQPRVDPQEYDPYTVAQRADAAAAADQVLARAAEGTVLATQVTDVCSPGQKNWWVQDLSAWTCTRSSRWVVAAGSDDPGQAIADYRAHLTEAGCTVDEATFGMVERYWADYGVAGQNANGDPYTVDDLPSASASCDSEQLGIAFRTPGDVETSAPSPASQRVVEYSALDLDAVNRSGAPLVVVIGTSRSYHSVSWDGSISGKDEDAEESDLPPGWCACYSGSKCDCPGG